jgi:hypothetical protein
MDKLDDAQRIELKQDLESIMATAGATERTIRQNAAMTLGYDTNLIELLDKERGYRARQREWEQYQE